MNWKCEEKGDLVRLQKKKEKIYHDQKYFKGEILYPNQKERIILFFIIHKNAQRQEKKRK